MVLTDGLVVLTAKERRSAQRRVLQALGIPRKARPDGYLVVLRVAVEVALGHVGSPVPVRRPQLRLPEVLPRKKSP